jgi:hypothetical protein
MQSASDSENGPFRRADALALDPYSPILPKSVGTDSRGDPLRLDPYSPLGRHLHRADRDDEEL